MIGATGQLAQDYIHFAPELGVEVEAVDFPEIDITKPSTIANTLDDRRFDALINTAAYHGYEAYKDKRPEMYYAVNVFGPFNLAEYAKKRDVKLVHFSTDYVFSGNPFAPREGFTEEDHPIPVNLYAASKLAGEQIIPVVWSKHFIFRIASLYGFAGCKAKNRSNFVEMVIAKLSSEEPMQVVDDIHMSPVSTRAVVYKSMEVIQSEKFGLYHLAGAGQCTWYTFAAEIARLSGLRTDILSPSTSQHVEQDIVRGENTAMRNQRLVESGFKDLHPWQSHLEVYLEERLQRGR